MKSVTDATPDGTVSASGDAASLGTVTGPVFGPLSQPHPAAVHRLLHPELYRASCPRKAAVVEWLSGLPWQSRRQRFAERIVRWCWPGFRSR